MIRKKGLKSKDFKKEDNAKIKSRISDKSIEESFDEGEDYFERKDLKGRQKRIYKGYIEEDRLKREKQSLYLVILMSIIIIGLVIVIIAYATGLMK